MAHPAHRLWSKATQDPDNVKADRLELEAILKRCAEGSACSQALPQDRAVGSRVHIRAEKDAILDDLRVWMEQGLMNSEIKPSILGISRDSFSCLGNKFDENPLPEFCSISWNLLDCLAVAWISHVGLQFCQKPLLLRCRLGERQEALVLNLVAFLFEDEQVFPLCMREDVAAGADCKFIVHF